MFLFPTLFDQLELQYKGPLAAHLRGVFFFIQFQNLFFCFCFCFFLFILLLVVWGVAGLVSSDYEISLSVVVRFRHMRLTLDFNFVELIHLLWEQCGIQSWGSREHLNVRSLCEWSSHLSCCFIIFSGLTNLKELQVSCTKVSDRGFTYLRGTCLFF